MFTIRKATSADCGLIHKLAWQIFPETYKEILSKEQIEYMMEWMYSLESIRQQMEEEGHVYLIACEECEAAGYVSVQQQGKDLFHLHKIYVLPYYQGAHCGSFLFREAVKYIRDVHPRPVHHGTERKPQQQSGRFLRAHGDEEIQRGRFSDRKRILYERLHHAVENRRISSGPHCGIQRATLRFQRATLRF